MDWRDDSTTAGDGAEGWEPRIQTCRIVLWRGYATAAFYARATDDLSGEPIGEASSSFRSRRGEVPDSPEVRAAHLEIASRLEAEGWIESGQGGEWYATEFARSILVPTQAPAVDPAPAEAVTEPELPPEPEPAPVPVRAVPPPPEPVPQPAVAAAPPARIARAQTRPRVDGWRMAAAAGLVAALGLLGWAATHPAALGAAGPPPQPTVARAAASPAL